MFVADNRVQSAKKYFFEQLNSTFSSTECKAMWISILSSFFGWSSSEMLLNNNQRLSESDLLRIRSVVKRLQANEPFQYIIGTIDFCNLTLKTDHRALIPRPETEELIEQITSLKHTFNAILDLCSGSGCIALALKQKYESAKVLGLEFSTEALLLSQENAKLNNLSVVFEQGDIFNWQSQEQYDLIVSNPPYIPQEEAAQMQPNVLDYEPHMALFVPNEDPLRFYKRILRIAEVNLLKDGFLALEIHENFAKESFALFNMPSFQNVKIYRDLQGKERILIAQKA
jgi:release factor glutamine methyltransferase